MPAYIHHLSLWSRLHLVPTCTATQAYEFQTWQTEAERHVCIRRPPHAIEIPVSDKTLMKAMCTYTPSSLVSDLGLNPHTVPSYGDIRWWVIWRLGNRFVMHGWMISSACQYQRRHCLGLILSYCQGAMINSCSLKVIAAHCCERMSQPRRVKDCYTACLA